MASLLPRGPLQDPQQWQGSDPSRTTPQQLLSRVLEAFARGIFSSWLYHWIQSSFGNILPTRLGQSIALVLAFFNTLGFIKQLDAYQTRTLYDNITSSAVIMIPMMSVLISKGTLLPFCGLLRSVFLVNGQLLPGIMPSLFFYIDQQTADVASFIEISLAILELLLFVAPGSTLFVLVAAPATFFILLIITKTNPFSRSWIRLKSTRLLQIVSQIWGKCRLISDRTLERASERIYNWRFEREQEAIVHLPPLCRSPLRGREIRLLEILRKRPLQAPRCHIFTVSVDEAPPYEAVSHVWSYPMNFVDLRVNHSFRMRVPRRLYDYLCHRQSYFNSKRIWIDALCIAQDDPDEKASQVKLMRAVFGNALNVVVWLASPAEAKDAVLVRNYFWWTRFVQSLTPSSKLFQVTTALSSSTRQAILRVLNQRWFKRVWMVQEIALAKRILILYGSVCFEWWELDCFVGLIKQAQSSSQFSLALAPLNGGIAVGPVKSISNVAHMSRFRKQVQEDRAQLELPAQSRRERYKMLPFEMVLNLTTGFDATDNRDRLFALLGTITNPYAALPTPDYRSSFTEVYLKAMVLLLTAGESPSVSLNLAGIGLLKDSLISSLQLLPSWIPDYLSYDPLKGRVARILVHDLPADFKLTISEDNRELYTRIFRIDAITWIGPVAKQAISFDRFVLDQEALSATEVDLASWVIATKALVARGAESSTDDPVAVSTFDHDSFWRTLFADRFANISPISPEHMASMNSVERLCEGILKADMSPSELTPAKDRAEIALVMGSLGEVSIGKRFAISEHGKYILAPPLSQEGDVLGTFEGFPDPFLFRRASVDRWQLVGGCYVDKFEVLRTESNAVAEAVTFI